jgi:calcineurin-like phosphoesterase family protein
MRIFFTADLHLNHANIIKYCNRPFKTVQEMNQTIINRWNEVVTDEDQVYLLGDFGFGPPHLMNRLLSCLKGQIFLIWGNHDRVWSQNCDRFVWQGVYKKIDVPWNGRSQTVVLMHYAMRVWEKNHYNSWQLYGHSHGTLPVLPGCLQMDVGVDPNDFRPVALEQVGFFMSQRMAERLNAKD